MSTTTVPTTGDELPPEILAVLRPDSTVTHEDTYTINGDAVWQVVVDGEPVADFDDGEDNFYGEDAAVQLRGKIESRVARLASRAALVAGLRELAGFLEAHPEVPDPHVWAIRWSRFGEGTEAFRAACDAMRERGFTVGDGTGSKDIAVRCEFAGGITLAVEARRDQIAEQRTETREVTEYVLPEWAQPTTPAEGTA